MPNVTRSPLPKALSCSGRVAAAAAADTRCGMSRVLTCVMVMILPGIGGGYLDNHYDTSYMMVAGWIIGPPFGLWQLIKLANSVGQENSDEAGN